MTGFALNTCARCGTQLAPDDFDGMCVGCDNAPPSHCADKGCEGFRGFEPELPAAARYCPFCGNELADE